MLKIDSAASTGVLEKYDMKTIMFDIWRIIPLVHKHLQSNAFIVWRNLHLHFLLMSFYRLFLN
jgi:hypothetical protein